ncbi:protein TolQ [Wenzhouxiangella sp. XN24]|uniref:protein TolQ n=1 Tax=Wenzhouxiangella sp. XN24 TaxID=2713569 RepID=UPI0013ED1A9F|nr:protein TolQ [Wenzhouxiangella sp. XN24]NGX16651.1 protein TolQ [Wenzhouxiangella sp. XN24]
MQNEMSIARLVLDASLVVQLVMLLLLLASVASWAVIIQKRRVLRQARANAENFEKEFWSGGDLNGLYKRLAGKPEGKLGMSGIFEAGFREFSRLRKQDDLQASQIVEGSRRAMLVSQMREADRLEQNLAMLATVGSTSPYVGLFGTVWGIMNSFIALGNVQQATLAMVAPGIAEALIATAMGLFAAIPAVIAYNRYADTVGRIESRYDTFVEEFSTILQRHARRAVES